jgi:hypothetical protein
MVANLLKDLFIEINLYYQLLVRMVSTDCLCLINEKDHRKFEHYFSINFVLFRVLENTNMCGNQPIHLHDRHQLGSKFSLQFQQRHHKNFYHQEGCTNNHQLAETTYECTHK